MLSVGIPLYRLGGHSCSASGAEGGALCDTQARSGPAWLIATAVQSASPNRVAVMLPRTLMVMPQRGCGSRGTPWPSQYADSDRGDLRARIAPRPGTPTAPLCSSDKSPCSQLRVQSSSKVIGLRLAAFLSFVGTL